MAEDTRRRLIAKIHIMQTEQGLDDTAYRMMLERITGKRSCAKMSPQELAKVADEMQRKARSTSRAGRYPHRRSSADPMMRKIGALLAELDKSWNYAHGMAKRMFGCDQVQWLTNDHMRRLVAALQIYADKRKAERRSA